MAQTEVTTQTLRTVGTNVNDLIARYNASVAKINEIGSQLDAMWDGDGNRKFMEILNNDSEKFSAMRTLLTKYVETLNQTAAMYEKAEGEVVQVVTVNKVR